MGDLVGAGRIDGSDVDEFGVVMKGLTLQQISPGKLAARKEYAVFDGLVCYRERWNRRLLGHGMTPDGYFMFATTASRSVHIDFCGHTVDSQHLGFGSPSSEVRFVTSETSKHVVLLVREEIVAEVMRDTPAYSALRGTGCSVNRRPRR